MTGIDRIGTMTQSAAVIQNARRQNESARFADMLRAAYADRDANNAVGKTARATTRLNGDIASGFEKSFSSPNDKAARAQGAAANSPRPVAEQKKIDKTSRLYEASLELESFFVKMMVNSMRKTVTPATKQSFAQEMYNDMIYDEYTTALTKNAGFGIADQIYLELSGR